MGFHHRGRSEASTPNASRTISHAYNVDLGAGDVAASRESGSDPCERVVGNPSIEPDYFPEVTITTGIASPQSSLLVGRRTIAAGCTGRAAPDVLRKSSDRRLSRNA